MARDIIEILNRTSQNVPSELQASAMASRGGGGVGADAVAVVTKEIAQMNRVYIKEKLPSVLQYSFNIK